MEQIRLNSSKKIAGQQRNILNKRIKMFLSINSNYNLLLSKEENARLTTKGWELKEFAWNRQALERLITSGPVSGNEYLDGHRCNSSWVGTHSVMLDFDDGRISSETLLKKQEGWEFVSAIFCSMNHMVDKGDGKPIEKLRALIPLKHPIRYVQDLQIVDAVFRARFPTMDKSCLQQARFFAHGRLDVFSFVATEATDDKKSFLDWKKLPGFGRDISYIPPAERKKAMSRQHATFFSLEDVVRNQYGKSTKLIDLPLPSPIFCPVCGDAEYRANKTHNAVISLNSSGIPMVYCSSCDSREMGVAGRGVYNLHPDEAYKFKTASTKFKHFVFVDIETQRYIGIRPGPGEENGEQIHPRMHLIRENLLLQHCKQFNLPIPEVFPQMDWKLDFESDQLVDFKMGIVNRYITPDILKCPHPEGATQADFSPEITWPFISHLLDHILSNDQEVRQHFLNDLAYMVQKRKKLITTYLFQGIQGTGKGTFFDYVIRPIFGEAYTAQGDESRFINQFNSFLVNSVFVLINEIHVDFTNPGGSRIMDKIKQAITDIYVMVEAKGKDVQVNVQNVCTFLFATNEIFSIILPPDDRRFNVAPRQEQQAQTQVWWLPDFEAVKAAIKEQLPSFVFYLKTHQIDYTKIAKTVNNEAKRFLQQLSTTFADDFFVKVHEGDIEWIKLALHKRVKGASQANDDAWTEVNAIINSLTSETPTSQNELLFIYNYMNNKDLNPVSFGKMAVHRLGEPKRIRIGGNRCLAYDIKWKETVC